MITGWRGGGSCPGNWCNGPCGYLRRCLTFRPRVQCCMAWYNALPAHLGARKNGRARERHAETPVLSCVHYFQGPATQAKNTIEMASLGEHAALTRPYGLAPCLWTLILDSGINKKAGLDGLSQSWNTLFRYIVFFFKVISGIRYQTFYKSLAILVSYEDKSGYIDIPLPPTLTPSMRTGPENVEGRSPCRENNDSLPMQIPRCDTYCVQFKEEKLVQLRPFFVQRNRNFVCHQDFGRRRVT